MEQAATERALTAEAEQTKVSLVSAEQDVEGLYAKVARQVKMELWRGIVSIAAVIGMDKRGGMLL